MTSIKRFFTVISLILIGICGSGCKTSVTVSGHTEPEQGNRTGIPPDQLKDSELDSVTGQKTVPEFVKDFVGIEKLARVSSLSIGFESVEEFKDFYIVPQNYQNSASHNLSSEVVKKGNKAHKAWIYKAYTGPRGQNNNHRAYPTIQLNKSNLGIIKTKALVEFYVYADVELSQRPEQDWLSLATFTSYSDIYWARTYLVNVDRNYRLHLMHIPHQGLKSPDIASNSDVFLPKEQWSKITVYIDYGQENRFGSAFIAVWQNGVLASASRFSDRIEPQRLPRSQQPPCLSGWGGKSVIEAERLCGLSYEQGLAQMHFGMYAPPKVKHGVIYNDELVVSTLREAP